MIWLGLFWWMVWRGLLSGIAVGALFGTVVGFVIGTVFGAFYGAILGIVTGIVNGLALTILTRFWFTPPQDSPQFRRSAVIVVVLCTWVTSVLQMSKVLGGVTILIVIPPIIASIVAGLMARRFPKYAVEAFLDKELAKVPSRHDEKYHR